MKKIDTPTRLTTLTLDFSRALRRFMHQCVKDDKVNFLQIHALALINEHKGITMKEFADHMKITSPSATSFIDRLVKLKWVRRVSSVKNRKVIRIALTDSGTQILVTKTKERAALMRRIISLIPPEDQKHLERIFTELNKHLHSPKISF